MWVPVSDWKDTEEEAYKHVPKGYEVLLEKCHYFRKWEYRYCIKEEGENL